MDPLILMIGATCSGKTTYVKKNLVYNYQYISEKAITKAMKFEHLDPKKNLNLVYIVVALYARSLMIQNLPIVVDDRNLSIESLVLWKKIANEHNYKTHGILMDTPFEICKKRMEIICKTQEHSNLLLEEFERLEALKHIFYNKHHQKDIFNKLTIVKYGGKNK